MRLFDGTNRCLTKQKHKCKGDDIPSKQERIRWLIESKWQMLNLRRDKTNEFDNESERQ